MSSQNRNAGALIDAEQLAQGISNQVDFFFLIRLIERARYYSLRAEELSGSQLGSDCHPKDEPVRFKGNYSLAFDAGSYGLVEKIPSEGHSISYAVTVNFIGLAGSAGVLPLHYTRLIAERVKQRDRSMVDFIDIFHHRLVSLFYRGWQKYRFTAQYEAYALANKQDPFSLVVECLTGKSGGMPQHLKNYYSGYFSKKIRTESGLCSMLSDFLGVKVEVDSFVGKWLVLDPSDRFSLSVAKPVQVLGAGIMLGNRCWGVQSKLEIRIGEMSHDAYLSSGPGSEKYELLVGLINAYLPSNLDVDIKFEVKNGRKTGLALGKGVQLQKNCWLQGKTSESLMAQVSVNRSGETQKKRNSYGI